jgi:hypothetical protein
MKYRNFFYPFKFSIDLAILTLSFLLSSFLAKKRIFLTQDFYQATKSFPHLGYRVVGFLDGHPQPSLGTLYLGKLEDLLPILKQKNVDEVVIALPGDASEGIDQIISI